METNNENIINDDTSLEVNESSNVQNETAIDPVSENEPTQEKPEKSGLKNVITGVAGAAVGAAGVIAATSFKHPDVPVYPLSHTHPIPEPVHFDGVEVPVAHHVNDNMNFNEAFASARHEVGPGGVFAWHGGIYGTYYANEWQGFSDKYQQQFSNFAYDIKPEPYPEEPYYADATEEEPGLGELPANDRPVEEAPELAELFNAQVTPAEAPESAEVFYEEVTPVAEPDVVGMFYEEVTPVVEPESAGVFYEEVTPVAEPESAGVFYEEVTPVVEPESAAASTIDVLSDNEDKVVIINAQNVIVVNASDTEANAQDVAVIPVEVDGENVAVVDTNLDDDYSITVVDDSDNTEIWPPDLMENYDVTVADDYQPIPDVTVADDYQPIPDTPEVAPDTDYANDNTPPVDYMPDFNNNDDITDF